MDTRWKFYPIHSGFLMIWVQFILLLGVSDFYFLFHLLHGSLMACILTMLLTVTTHVYLGTSERTLKGLFRKHYWGGGRGLGVHLSGGVTQILSFVRGRHTDFANLLSGGTQILTNAVIKTKTKLAQIRPKNT